MFARHGIPEQVLSDNGPQFAAHSFAQFAEEYGFTHITASPRYPQANGEVERAVKTVKELLKKSSDPYKTLLAYRSTAWESGLSPAELLMGRRIRTTVPTVPANLNPEWSFLDQFKNKDASLKARQKKNFDLRHSAKTLPTLVPGETVWISDQKQEATVMNKSGTPRSYIVETQKRQVLRRNRRHLTPIPATSSREHSGPAPTETPGKGEPSSEPDVAPSSPRRSTRSGRQIRPPERFRDT